MYGNRAVQSLNECECVLIVNVVCIEV